MKQPIHILLFIFFSQIVFAQASIQFIPDDPKYKPVEKTIFYRLGEKNIPLVVKQYGNRTDLVFISLHNNEFTSVEASKRILENTGGLLIEVENDLKRNIQFRLGRIVYKVDPNRIFSRNGIEKSLKELGRSSPRAIIEIEKFGQRLLQLIPENTTCIIALHNNTPDFFNVREYTPGNKRAGDSKKVFINSKEDADDFFLTTDNQLYEKLAENGFNTILQDNKNCTEDGSLSVYLGKKNIRYVNCETEHGKTEHYFEMMQTLINLLLQK